MLNFCDFIQVYVFTTNHHLEWRLSLIPRSLSLYFILDQLKYFPKVHVHVNMT